MALWTTFLGANRDVTTIDFPTIDRYARARRARALIVPEHPGILKKVPTDRTIGDDIAILQAALNHAKRVRRPNGDRVLTTNPIEGYPKLKNKNVRRPLATYDRFLAVRAVADDIDPQKLFGPFMELIEGLGWRVTAVCQLRASDVDRRSSDLAPHGRLHKRGEVDKEGADAWIPMSPSVRAAVDRVLAINPAIGEWPLFPSPRAKTTVTAIAHAEIPRPWRRDHARDLLGRAEKAATLEPLAGSDFHAYRRKWATERKHLPARDVAAAGQWKDLRTLETAYTHPDDETMLQVVLEPRKLRDQRQGGAGA